MQVARWGNSLAVRLPKSVVEALDLKPGDEIRIRAAGARDWEVARQPDRAELMARLRAYRGTLPADFEWDRDAAHER